MKIGVSRILGLDAETNYTTPVDMEGLSMNWTPTELMVTAAARELDDGESVFVGVGIPMPASDLAKSTHSPNIQLINESGIIGSPVFRGPIPTTVGDPKLVSGSVGLIPMFEGFITYLHGGNIDLGFLSGAQIDRFGNINSTVIGDYENPDVRLPRSDGACEIAVDANRTVAILPHERQCFHNKSASLRAQDILKEEKVGNN